MAYIVSGDLSDKLTIETGKAARISGYGTEDIDKRAFAQCPTELARGTLSFGNEFIITSATLAIWALRNSSTTRFIRINNIYIQIFVFPGAAGGSDARITIRKSTNVTSISGGTVLIPSIFKTSLGQATGIDSRNQAIGAGGNITVNNEVVQGEVLSFGSSNGGNNTRPYSLFEFGKKDFPYSEPIDLLNNEALVMRGVPAPITFNAAFFMTVLFTEYAFP